LQGRQDRVHIIEILLADDVYVMALALNAREFHAPFQRFNDCITVRLSSGRRGPSLVAGNAFLGLDRSGPTISFEKKLATPTPLAVGADVPTPSTITPT
jgi:hypothetical protein